MPHRVETYSPIMTQPAIAPAYSPYALPPPASAKARREPYGTSPSPSEGDRRPVCTPPAEAPVAYTGYGYASGHDERTPAPYAYAVYAGYPGQHYPLHTYQVPPPPAGKGAGAGVPIIHTDDAATKLSDRVRRRCFNCCSTDTSTWRRSTLSPGKVLCNKCGLFERTHSRPRPAQFPHKRGPLASSALKRAQPYPPPATHYATTPLPSPSPSAKPASDSAQPPSSGEQERDARQHE